MTVAGLSFRSDFNVTLTKIEIRETRRKARCLAVAGVAHLLFSVVHILYFSWFRSRISGGSGLLFSSAHLLKSERQGEKLDV